MTQGIKGQSNGWSAVATAVLLLVVGDWFLDTTPKRGTIAGAIVCGSDSEACNRLEWHSRLAPGPQHREDTERACEPPQQQGQDNE